MLTIRNELLSWQELDGEVIVLDLKSGEYLRLNSSASLIWKSLAVGDPRSVTVDAMCHAFGLDTASASADVDRFLEQALGAGILEHRS